ncbi:hypothetical protein L596_014230 [Steinernema carpocapsae]|uniref:Protein kinase domain-containing protein n=1 Tax=Steinernema carpocapsae TaxID=34508 RepID=A0A4U5NCF5_STECR|nr:hypothetical protein L596_014230 [Steinernema carpocapsae]
MMRICINGVSPDWAGLTTTVPGTPSQEQQNIITILVASADRQRPEERSFLMIGRRSIGFGEMFGRSARLRVGENRRHAALRVQQLRPSERRAAEFQDKNGASLGSVVSEGGRVASAGSWIQVDLEDTYVVREVETQGRYGNGTGMEYPTFYYIDYQRPGSPWIRYRNRTGHQLMSANGDTTTAVMRELDPPIVASRVRLRPYSESPRTVCLRWELHGCKHKDGLLFYSTSHKGFRSGDEDLRDTIFEDSQLEGVAETRQLRGLGALYDGFISKEDPKIAATVRNASWIGWSHSETDGKLDFTFEFDEIRNFSEVTLYCYGVAILRVEMLFSLDGESYSLNTQILSVQRPNKTLVNWRHFPWVIPTHGRQGRFIKISLVFNGDRFYMTEINFNSEIAKYLVRRVDPKVIMDIQDHQIIHTVGGREDPVIPEGSVIYTSHGLQYVIFTVLIILLILITAVLCLLVILKKRGPDQKILHPYQKGNLVTTLSGDGTTSTIVTNSNGHFKNNLYMSGDPMMSASQQRMVGNGLSSKSSSGTLNLRGSRTGTFTKDSATPSLLDFNFPPPPSTCSSGVYTFSTYDNNPRPLDRPRRVKGPMSTMNSPIRRPYPPLRARETLPRHLRPWPKAMTSDSSREELHYAASPIAASNCAFENSPKPQIAVDRVRLKHPVGEGKFTVVYLCEVTTMPGVPLAIKKLKEEDHEPARRALKSEVEILSKLDHSNIVRYSLLMEYVPMGDIRQFIRREAHTLNYGSLVYMCTGIASGLKYLEQRGIVHGHLSPQSCLVESDLNIRVCSPRGACHHAQLRYSAPESIILNSWTSKSDVWSFAVTVWEILSYCQRIPHDQFSNADLVDNATAVVQQQEAVRLEFDESCPKEMTDLLMECWSEDPSTRPRFLEIHLFLSRKNLGFSPTRQF